MLGLKICRSFAEDDGKQSFWRNPRVLSVDPLLELQKIELYLASTMLIERSELVKQKAK
jgi:hypothetical protein